MKKKTGTSTTVVLAATTTASGAGSDSKPLIHDHSLFFDKLVELIPARFYLPSNADDKVWFQGLSKQEKEEAKKKSIENIKKSRRVRLDPEQSSKTTIDLLKESLENENLKSKATDDDVVGSDGEEGMELSDFRDLEGDGRSVTYEELRHRLHKKIEELRAGRGGPGGGRENERRLKKEGKKRKRNEEWSKKAGKSNESGRREKGRDVSKQVSEAAKGIVFGKMKLGDETDRDGGKNKKRKLSKEKELERALKMEEEAKKDPELAKKQAWKIAADRAMGKKVHDKPKLLKESIKKEERRHKKSMETWKDRMDTVQTKKREKQDKRKGNIKNKIDEKKKRKIEKREKKLMRPGFEGRKEGFINGD